MKQKFIFITLIFVEQNGQIPRQRRAFGGRDAPLQG